MRKRLCLFLTVLFICCAFPIWADLDSCNFIRELKIITMMKDGFKKDLEGKPRSKWLGSGRVEVLHIDVYPDVKIVPSFEGNTEIVSRVPLETLIDLRKDQQIADSQSAGWAAWVDDNGLLSLMLTIPLQKSEQQAIEALQTVPDWKEWDITRDWTVDIISGIGPYRFWDNWCMNASPLLSRIFLGEVSLGKEEDYFRSAQKKLADLRILQWQK